MGGEDRLSVILLPILNKVLDVFKGKKIPPQYISFVNPFLMILLAWLGKLCKK